MSWRSILQSTVALPTTETDYKAMTEAMKEAIWFQGLLDDLEIEHNLLNINCDNMSGEESGISCKDEAHRCQVPLCSGDS